jgi:hypothetical protein
MTTAITIAKVAQSLGAATLPDNRTHTNRMEIHSGTSNRVYLVAQRTTGGSTHGQWECSCMGWIRYRKCKHLTAMLPALRMLGAPSASRLG